jgi:chromosome segregation ATPase
MEAVQTANPPSFESVWAILQEVTESQKETDRQMKETDRQMKETARQMKETARRMKETDRQISRLGSSTRELIEDFAAFNLFEKFEELGFQFTSISRNHTIKDKRKEHEAELDIVLEDSEYAMVVEVKSLLNKNDVIEHQDRMKIVRERADRCNDKRKHLAAVAGATVDGAAREYALESGIYVIEQTGDTVRIKAPPSLTYW